MIQIDNEEDRQSRWEALLTKTEPTPLPIEPQEEDRQQRWQSLLTKPPQEEQRTWGDVLAKTVEGQKKLWGGELGVKIGGKTPVEHIGEFFKPVAEEAIGLGEGAVAGVSGLAAFIPSLIGGVGAKAIGKDFEESEEIQRKIAELLTHEPVTEKGKIYGEVATSPFALFGWLLDKASADMDAETEAAVRLGSGVVLVAAGASLHGAAKTYVKSAAKKGGAAIAKAKALIRKSKDVPPELKTVVEKIPELPPELKPTPEQIAQQEAIHKQTRIAREKGEVSPIATAEDVPMPKITKKQAAALKKSLAEAEAELKAGKPTPKQLEKDLTEVHSGFNIFDEFKKSAEYLKTGKVPITPPKRMKGKVVKPIPPPEVTPMDLMAESPVYQKVVTALKEAKPKRAEQEVIFTVGRGKKMARGQEAIKGLKGVERIKAFRAAQKGRMERVEYEPIKITQEELNFLADKIMESPKLTEWEKLDATDGFAKLFGEVGVEVPTQGEMILLNRVYPKEFTKAMLDKRGDWLKMKDQMLDVAGVPRAIMSSYDLSFGGRQGIFLMARYPKQFFKSWGKQFKQFGSEKAYEANWKDITDNKWYSLARKADLALTERGAILAKMEERFMSNFAEKIPLIGKGVKASGRAYTGFANRLRMDVFAYIMDDLARQGKNPKKNMYLAKEAANFVNVGSGRGNLKSFEKSAVILNQLLFSPRLIRSRMTLLNPKYYIKLPKGVRKHAVQSLLAFAGMGMTILTTAKLASKIWPDAIEVGDDIFSADFGKIKIGNTRIDIWGGFQQYIRTAAQFSKAMVEQTIKGEAPRPSAEDILFRWATYKEAPIVSFAHDLVRGQTPFGEKFRLDEELAKRFIPMVVQDIYDITKDDPSLLPISTLGIFGIGLQTYPPRSKKGKFSLGY